MKYMKKALCVLATMVVCLTSTITAFADETPSYTKEEAYQAILDTDLDKATRSYDIDCVDIHDLTQEDLKLFFDIYWYGCGNIADYPEDYTYLLKDYFRSLNDTFYGKASANDKLQEIYQQARELGYDTSAAYNSHTWDATTKADSSTDSFVTTNSSVDATATPVDGTINNNGMTTAVTISTISTTTTRPEQEEEKSSHILFIILGLVVVGIGTGLIITLRKQKK